MRCGGNPIMKRLLPIILCTVTCVLVGNMLAGASRTGHYKSVIASLNSSGGGAGDLGQTVVDNTAYNADGSGSGEFVYSLVPATTTGTARYLRIYTEFLGAYAYNAHILIYDPGGTSLLIDHELTVDPTNTTWVCYDYGSDATLSTGNYIVGIVSDDAAWRTFGGTVAGINLYKTDMNGASVPGTFTHSEGDLSNSDIQIALTLNNTACE